MISRHVRAFTGLMALSLVGPSLKDGLFAQTRQLTLEVTPVHGTLGYSWTTTSAGLLGLEVGFGFPELDKTLAPSNESLIDFLHVGVFLRGAPTRSIALDARVQSGLAELNGCSGCLPGLLTAVSGGAFWGGHRFKIGARLTAGMIKEGGLPSTFVVNLTPLAGLITFGR